MTIDDASSRGPWAATAAGALALTSGVAVLAVVGWWFSADMGWNGSGSAFRSQWRGLAPVLPLIVVAVLGLAALLTRNRPMAGRPGRLAFVAVTALSALLTPLALLTYPRIDDAVLTAVAAPDGGPGWHIRLPVTEVLGVRSITGGRMVIEGREDQRQCRSVLRAVTLDLATGARVKVKNLPSTYPDISQAPPPPGPLDPARFTVEQGSSPFVCSS